MTLLSVDLLAILGLLAISWTAFPLLRTIPPPEDEENKLLAVLKTQWTEVERDLDRAFLTEEEATGLRREIQRRALTLVAASPALKKPLSRRICLIVAVFLILLIPSGAVICYKIAGAPGVPDTPDSFSDWMDYAQNAVSQDNIAFAISAYAQAAAFRPDSFEAQAGLASVLLAQAVQDEAPPSEEFLKTVEVLRRIAPESPEALYFGGVAALAKGHSEEARSLWIRLRDHLPEGNEGRHALEEQIDHLPSLK